MVLSGMFVVNCYLFWNVRFLFDNVLRIKDGHGLALDVYKGNTGFWLSFLHVHVIDWYKGRHFSIID